MIERVKSAMVGAGAAWVLWLMLALSVISLAIMLERAWLFWSLRDDVEALKEAKARIDAAGVPVVRTTEHATTLSLYVSDPDGITVELYADTDPATWRDHPQPLGSQAKPLAL